MCHLLQIYIHILPRYSTGFFSPPSALLLYSPYPWTFPRPTHFTLHSPAHSFPAFFVSIALIIHFHTVNCSPQLQCPGGLANLPAVQEQQKMWVGSLGQEDPLEEGMATHSSTLCLETPMDRGAWWATVQRVSKSGTQLKWLSMHACNLFISIDLPVLSISYTWSHTISGLLNLTSFT